MPSTHTPRRIACLQPSATVILDAIGELGRVVACTRYCADVVPEVADGSRVILADSWTADTAQIVAAQPDLVIAAVPYQEKAVSDILRASVRFLGLAPKTLGDIYTDIATIAGVVGATDRGEEVIAAMQRQIGQIHARVRTAAIGRPRVWCEEWGKPLIASQRWVAELVEAAGGDFVVTPGHSGFGRGYPSARSGGDDRGVVRCGRSGAAGKDHCGAGLAGDHSGAVGARLLHSGRISQHTRAYPAARSRGAGFRDSSRTFPAHERNPADYWGSRIHCREFHALS